MKSHDIYDLRFVTLLRSFSFAFTTFDFFFFLWVGHFTWRMLFYRFLPLISCWHIGLFFLPILP